MIGRASAERDNDSDDNIYYNINIRTESEESIPARYSETRVQPIIENPSQYEMAVARFNIPGFSIPIMFFKDGLAPYDADEKYQVYMSYDGLDFAQTVQFIPGDTPDTTKLYPGRKPVWNYISFLRALNNTLFDTFTAFKLLKPLAPPTEAPYVTFDAKTQLFTLYAEQAYDSYGVPTIKVGFNQFLYRLFLFPSVLDQPPNTIGKYYAIISDEKNNSETIDGTPYFLVEQESGSLYMWNEAYAIRLSTNSIPVSPEFVSGQKNQVSRVLTDFELADDASSRTTIQFFPQGELRYYDLKSSYPLYDIDLRVDWLTDKGEEFPIYIVRDEALTCKLKFRKKIKDDPI